VLSRRIVSCVYLVRINLWRLFANFSRIDNEFEGICVLILLHQLQIREPSGAFERIAVGKLRLRGFDQRCCQLIVSVSRKAEIPLCCTRESGV
jgi:hypothetical protein